jgi:DNA-binding transcriptional ArsR family regulator
LPDPWDDNDYVDPDMAKAMTHPLRNHILAELNKQAMSPSQFSKRHDLKLPTVSYHFRVLEKADCVEVVCERPVRGSVEHFYRATKKALFDGKAWEDLPESVRGKVSGRILSDFLGVAAEAMLEGTFDSRKDRHAAWQRIHIDEQGWKETSDIILQAFREVMKSSKEANRRLIRSGEKGLMATWGLLLFESPMPATEDEAGEATA